MLILLLMLRLMFQSLMVSGSGGEDQDGFPHRLLQGRPRHDGFIPLLLFVVLHYLLFFIVIASMRSRGPSLPLLLVPWIWNCMESLLLLATIAVPKKAVLLCSLTCVHLSLSCIYSAPVWQESKSPVSLEDPSLCTALVS